MTTEIKLTPSFADVHYTFPEYPRQVRIESAFSCPMACVVCHAWGSFKTPERPKTFASMEFIESILQDIASWEKPLHEIVPVDFSEWPAYPKWYEMGQMIDRYIPDTMMSLPTTGISFSDEENLKKLASIKTLKWLNFSINAYFEETWERFHRRPRRLMARILELPERFRDLRPDVTINISMVYDPLITSVLEAELFEAHWKAKDFRVGINTASYVKNPKRKPEVPLTIACRSIFDGLVVFADGKVGTGCCFDSNAELTVGGFPKGKLLDIWKGAELKALGELHNSGKRTELDLCRNCTFS